MKTILIVAGIWFIVALIALGILYLIIMPDSEYFDDYDNTDEDILL